MGDFEGRQHWSFGRFARHVKARTEVSEVAAMNPVLATSLMRSSSLKHQQIPPFISMVTPNLLVSGLPSTLESVENCAKLLGVACIVTLIGTPLTEPRAMSFSDYGADVFWTDAEPDITKRVVETGQIALVHMPVLDMRMVCDEHIRWFSRLLEAAEAGRRAVLVHCWKGGNRSAGLARAGLALSRGLTSEQVLAAYPHHYTQAPENLALWEYIQRAAVWAFFRTPYFPFHAPGATSSQAAHVAALREALEKFEVSASNPCHRDSSIWTAAFPTLEKPMSHVALSTGTAKSEPDAPIAPPVWWEHLKQTILAAAAANGTDEILPPPLQHGSAVWTKRIEQAEAIMEALHQTNPLAV